MRSSRCRTASEAPGLIRDRAEGLYRDFICTSGYIEDDEDGPSLLPASSGGAGGGRMSPAPDLKAKISL